MLGARLKFDVTLLWPGWADEPNWSSAQRRVSAYESCTRDASPGEVDDAIDTHSNKTTSTARGKMGWVISSIQRTL